MGNAFRSGGTKRVTAIRSGTPPPDQWGTPTPRRRPSPPERAGGPSDVGADRPIGPGFSPQLLDHPLLHIVGGSDDPEGLTIAEMDADAHPSAVVAEQHRAGVCGPDLPVPLPNPGTGRAGTGDVPEHRFQGSRQRLIHIARHAPAPGWQPRLPRPQPARKPMARKRLFGHVAENRSPATTVSTTWIPAAGERRGRARVHPACRPG